MTWRNARKQGWVFLLFSPDSDDRLSLNFHRFVIWYVSCDTRSVGLGQYCLPKGSNGSKYCIVSAVPSFVKKQNHKQIIRVGFEPLHLFALLKNIKQINWFLLISESMRFVRSPSVPLIQSREGIHQKKLPTLQSVSHPGCHKTRAITKCIPSL